MYFVFTYALFTLRSTDIRTSDGYLSELYLRYVQETQTFQDLYVVK